MIAAPRLAPALLLLAVACRTVAPSVPPPVQPVALPRPTLLPVLAEEPDWTAEQHVVARHPQGAQEFDAVVEKRGETLVMTCLAPWGSRALTVVQRGTAVTVQVHVPAPLPFEPERMLVDVQRTFRVHGPPGANGYESGGEFVVDTADASGCVTRREIRSARTEPTPSVTVDYDPPRCGDAMQGEARFADHRFGYGLTIRTVRYARR